MKFLSKIPNWLVVLVILALASFVRLYRLESVPPSPYWEEVALGYDAYSIAKTGKDFHGNSYPVIAFPSYGDYKPSGYFYAIVPFIKLFGLRVLSIRLPAALAGILSVLFVYLIGAQMFSKRVGMVAMVFMAISPWAIQFSRGGWEVNLAMTLTLVGAYFLLKARAQPLLLTLSVLGFGSSMYVYHAARLFSPLFGMFGGLSLVTFTKKRPWIKWMLALVLAIVFVLPFVINLKDQSVSSRFSQTTVLSDLEPVLKSNALIAAHGNALWARLVYHRFWFYAQIVISGWASHFSPEFLFVRADGNLRHWNGFYGPLYYLDAAFIAVSVVVLILSVRRREYRKYFAPLGLVLVWVILAGVPAALVRPVPHALRFLFAAPGFVLLAAFGVCWIYEAVPKKLKIVFAVAVTLGYLYLFGSYFYWYQNIYSAKASQDWQYGYAQVFEFLKTEKRPGEAVYMTREEGRPSMYYLFYSKYDPAKIQALGASLPKDQQELLRVDDYNFTDVLPAQPGLYATSELKVPKGTKVLDTVRRLDGSIVWQIWRR